MFTNAPNLVMFTTLPCVLGAELGGGRVEDELDPAPRPRSTCGASFEPMVTVPTTPSSLTDTSAPVSSVIVLMTLPLGPMTSPILSIGISKLTIFGAVRLHVVARRGDRVAS